MRCVCLIRIYCRIAFWGNAIIHMRRDNKEELHIVRIQVVITLFPFTEWLSVANHRCHFWSAAFTQRARDLITKAASGVSGWYITDFFDRIKLWKYPFTTWRIITSFMHFMLNSCCCCAPASINQGWPSTPIITSGIITRHIISAWILLRVYQTTSLV